jgi:tripartite-type tricarboxylate transporter receptor subunit TctC
MSRLLERALGCVLALASCCVAGSATAEQVSVAVGAHGGGRPTRRAHRHRGALGVSFLQEKLGQPFVVENISGASSTIGAVQVQRSAPDGYTLLVNPSLFVITPMLMNVSYDVVKDFTPISNFGTVPIAVGINPAIPAKTLQEFIALAKADPENSPGAPRASARSGT